MLLPGYSFPFGQDYWRRRFFVLVIIVIGSRIFFSIIISIYILSILLILPRMSLISWLTSTDSPSYPKLDLRQA
jgi:hypothetical protein